MGTSTSASSSALLAKKTAFSPILSYANPRHDGAGGQCAFADPEHKIGFAFVTSEMRGGEVEDDRATRLIGDLRLILQS